MAEATGGKLIIDGSGRVKDVLGSNLPPPQNMMEAYLLNIAESTQKIAESSEPIKLPDTKEGQETVISRLVEQIEANDSPIVPTPGLYSTVNELNMRHLNMLFSNENCDSEIKKRATARLRLQHCYAVATAIPGSAKDAAPFLLQTFQQAESKKWALEGTDFGVLRETPTLKVGDAFMLLQEAYTKGVEVSPGKEVKLGNPYLEEGDLGEAMKKIEADLGGGKEARKSLQLAYRVAKATLETSVWNTFAGGGDPVSEAIYFESYRGGRLNAARDRGPMITIKRIKGFGTSYFRNAQTLERINLPDPNNAGQNIKGYINENQEFDKNRDREFNKHLFLNSDEMHPGYISEIQDPSERIKRMRIRNSLDRDINLPQYIPFGDLDFNRIKAGDYAGWLGILVPRILTFKSMCLQTTWAYKDLTSDTIEGWIAASDTADPEEVLRLRAEFSVGLFGSIIENTKESVGQGWNSKNVRATLETMTRNIPTNKGDISAYLSKDAAKWVIKTIEETYNINYYNKLSKAFTDSAVLKRAIV